MNDFWKSYDITALEYGVNYQCYPLYGRIHLTELALSLIFILSAALWYRHSGGCSSDWRECAATHYDSSRYHLLNLHAAFSSAVTCISALLACASKSELSTKSDAG